MDSQVTSDSLSFALGEVAILVQPEGTMKMKDGVPTGSEVTVVSGLILMRFRHSDGSEFGVMHGYRITVQDGRQFGCPPGWLRKKRPPQREDQQLVSWDICAWKPKQVAA